MAIVYSRTFDAGDFSEFTSSVTTNGTTAFPAGLASSVASLEFTQTANNGRAYGEDSIASLGTNTRLRFYIKDDGASNSATDLISYVAFFATGTLQWIIGCRYSTTNKTIRAAVREDGGGFEVIETASIYGRGTQIIEARIQKATDGVSSDGELQLFLDGVSVALSTNMQLFTQTTPNEIEFGVGTVDFTNTVTGPLIVDELVVRNDDIPIGPRGGAALHQHRRRRKLHHKTRA